MRVRARLTSLTAVAAALAIFAPMAPANAVPSVAGEYATATPTVLSYLKSDECRDAAQLRFTADLIGIGDAVESQGYYGYDKSKPVYTYLEWDTTVRITGPNNYYASGGNYTREFPTSELFYDFDFCPTDFGTGTVTPGEYKIETVVSVSGQHTDICSTNEGCLTYENIYQKSSTQTITLDYSPECYSARATAAELTPKVKKAKKALKRAKASRDRATIKRAKKKLRKLKGKLATARSNVEGLC